MMTKRVFDSERALIDLAITFPVLLLLLFWLGVHQKGAIVRSVYAS